MSLLLEALKKSEDERQRRADNRPLHSTLASTAAGSRNNLALLAALLFGGIAAGLAIWVFFGSGSSSSKAPAAQQTEATPQPAPPALLPQTAPPPQAAPQAPAAVAQSTEPAKPAADVANNRSLYGSNGVAQEAPASTVTPAPAPAPLGPLTPPAPAKAAPPALAKPPQTSVAKQDSTATTPSLTVEYSLKLRNPDGSIKKAAPSAEIISLSDLPPDVRAELPLLKLAGYMHAENANDRLIGVNDKLVKVGDEIIPGLQLQSLAPNAAVFAYKGYRFRVSQ